MFYLSRAEQAALLLLIALLLAGAGVLTYARGRHSADATATQPLFLPAPAQTSASQPARRRASARPPYTNHPPSRSGGESGRQGAPASPRTGVRREEPAAGLISLNTASQQELERLPGIGPVLAERIVAHREQRRREGHRGFESKDELLNVAGIGPKRYAAIRDLVSL